MNQLDPSSDSSPWLSVIITTFNGAQFLERTFLGIEEQDLKGVEIVVSDDGSTDDTLRIVEDFASRIPIRILRHQSTGNWIDNTNFAVNECSGDFVTFLHQDDFWLSNRISSVRTAIESHPQPNLWIHDSNLVDEKNKVIGTVRCPFGRSDRLLASPTFIERLLVQNFLMMPAPTFRRSTYLECGGMNPSLWYAGDWDLWLRLGSTGMVGYIRETLSSFRVHRNSQTWTRSRDSSQVEEQLTEVFETNFALWPQPNARVRRAVRKASTLSSQTNVWLMARLNDEPRDGSALAFAYLTAGPRVLTRVLRDSRLVERAIARLRTLRQPA